MKNTKQPNPRRKNGLFRGALMNKACSLILGVMILALIIGLGGFLRRIAPSTAVRSSESNDAVKAAAGMPARFGSIPLIAHAKAPAQPTALDTLAAQMSRETDDLKVVTHPDGRRSVHLAGRFIHMSAIATGADGNPEVQCFSDYQELSTSLQGTASDEASPIRHDR